MKRTWSRKIETNILRVYEAATLEEREEGMFWYSRAHALGASLAAKYGIATYTAIGVIAVISPGSTWGRTLIDAETLMKAHVAGRRLPTVGSYGRANIRKAARILRGELLLNVVGPSPKVRAFYSNMLEPASSEAVTIDRHAKALALGITENRDKAAIVRPAEYRYLAWHYRIIAARLNIQPHQLQAVCWVTWKRMIDEKEV